MIDFKVIVLGMMHDFIAVCQYGSTTAIEGYGHCHGRSLKVDFSEMLTNRETSIWRESVFCNNVLLLDHSWLPHAIK